MKALFRKESFMEIHEEIGSIVGDKRCYPQDTTYYLFGIPVYKKRIRVLLYTASIDGLIPSNEKTRLLFHRTKKVQNTGIH